MRVITGTARGRKLITPEGLHTRPTSARVKEAIFNILQFEIEGRIVLDMFAGSGQMGIEALSRGAKKAVFLDSSAQAISAIKENIKVVGFTDKSQILLSDSYNGILQANETFDIVFIDPPYGENRFVKALSVANDVMKPYSVAICEYDRLEEVPEKVKELVLQRTYRYGKTSVALYRKSQGENE